MRAKIYLVTELRPDCGCEVPVAVKATFESALAVARLGGGRRVRKVVVTRDDRENIIEQHPERGQSDGMEKLPRFSKVRHK